MSSVYFNSGLLDPVHKVFKLLMPIEFLTALIINCSYVDS